MRNYNLPKAVAPKMSRLIAKGIDLFIVLILSFFFYPLGLMFSLGYMAISDALQGGQSVGKKFMGLSVVRPDGEQACSFRQSTIRNLPFLIPLFFGIIPLWGFLFFILLGAPLVALELYLLLTLDSGRRLGDVMADTFVIGQDGGPLRSRPLR